MKGILRMLILALGQNMRDVSIPSQFINITFLLIKKQTEIKS